MANPISSDTAHGAAQAIGAHERRFGVLDHTALWFSMGVGLLVMQVGASLMPALSAREALLAIVAGSLLGAGLLAWVASLGARHGLSSSALIGSALGRSFALLPVGLNVLQLLGWTAFELVVMRDGSAALLQRMGLGSTWSSYAITLVWGALLIALAAGSMVGLVRRFVSRFGLPLVVLSLIWLSWQFGQRLAAQGFAAWWNKPGAGGTTALQALDLVIAMPVSWLPLVADYARYGRSARSTLIALGFILIDEVDNAYGDVHSGAVSAHFLSRSRWTIRRLGVALAALATAAALVLPIHSLEPFLLLLSSIFVPLFGVVLSQLALGALPARAGVRWGPALLWLAGIACFHLGGLYWPQWGSALPCLAFTLMGGLLVRALAPGPQTPPVGAR